LKDPLDAANPFVANTTNMTFRGIEFEALLILLDQVGYLF